MVFIVNLRFQKEQAMCQLLRGSIQRRQRAVRRVSESVLASGQSFDLLDERSNSTRAKVKAQFLAMCSSFVLLLRYA
ncbi:MAG TPA: hypothetical protein VLR94_06020 [Acidobacteriota bacterium]|nr:hypothetical protein [Acidobacteriota bacterium]